MATKICIVEDNLPVAGMYEFKLKQNGFDVRIAYDGESGLRLVEKYKPDLLLLDLRVPLLPGEDLLEHLRATDWGSEMRVIILTNISKDEAPQKLRFLNVDRYIVKAHSTPQQVVDTIKDVLK